MADRSDCATIGFLPGMRPMEHGPDVTQLDANPRTAALGNSGSQSEKQRLDVAPSDVGANRIDKHGFQNLALLAAQLAGWSRRHPALR
jgi:hypothetical protein